MKSNFTSRPGFAGLVVLCCFFAAVKSVQAQAYLSIQGISKTFTETVLCGMISNQYNP